MTNFNWGGKGQPFCSGELEPYTRPEKPTPTVYQLSSAQDLSWFYLCSAWLRSGYDRAVTRFRPFIGAPSQPIRSGIRTPSHKGRTWLGLGRVLVGIKAGTANNSFRPISNPLRRFFAQSSPSHTLAMPCLYTGYEQEMPMNGTRNHQGLHKDETRIALESTKDKTRNNQETPKSETRIRQESRNSTSKNTPERYCKGTGKVLKSGGKGTGEVLESYQRCTKEALTGSRSEVALERDGDCFGVVPTSRNNEEVVNQLYINRLVLRRFRAFCEEFRSKVDSMSGNEYRGSQISLKCFEGFVSSKIKLEPIRERPSEDSEQVLQYGPRRIGTQRGDALGVWKLFACLMIFCVFSNPDLLGTSAVAQSPHRADIRQAEIMPLQIGDTIPEALWKMPIKVVNYPDGSDTILLKAYRSEPFILLDFWSTHCAPCIRALNEFDKIAKSIDGHLPILAMHVDSLQDLEKYVSDKGWKIPVVGVNESTIVNNYFFNRKQYGGLILIMDGIFYASPDSKVLTVEMFEQLLKGERPRFETKYPELLHSWCAEGEGRW